MSLRDTDDSAVTSASNGNVNSAESSVPPPYPSACTLYSSLFTHSPSPFKAVSGSLHLPGLHSPLPADLYFWPDGRSYTGQAVAEFHTLGSPPLLDAVLRAACDAGARLAQPGEFTLRAFLAGRIDLTQAEAVLGVIDATDEGRLHAALEQLAGGLSRPLLQLRDALLDLLCHLEAGFDFPNEDVAFITPDQLAEQLDEARHAAAVLAAQLQSRRRDGHETRAVLVGPPNAGKSSLFNALVGRAGAIVSHHPGTTRDYLSAAIDLDGVPIRFVDTAGVTPEPGGIASDGQTSIQHAAEQLARTQGERADVRIRCIEVAQACHMPVRLAPLDPPYCQRQGERPGCLGQSEAVAENASPADLLVLTKADLAPDGWKGMPPGLLVSSVTGRGLDALRAALRDAALAGQLAPDHAVASTAARCGQSLREAVDAINSAGRLVSEGAGEELVAAEIRAALDAIGRVAGTVHTDDVLDRVFSRFCIGK